MKLNVRQSFGEGLALTLDKRVERNSAAERTRQLPHLNNKGRNEFSLITVETKRPALLPAPLYCIKFLFSNLLFYYNLYPINQDWSFFHKRWRYLDIEFGKIVRR